MRFSKSVRVGAWGSHDFDVVRKKTFRDFFFAHRSVNCFQGSYHQQTGVAVQSVVSSFHS